MNYRIPLFGVPLLLLLFAIWVFDDETIVLGDDHSSETLIQSNSSDAEAMTEPIDELFTLFETVTSEYELTVHFSGPIGEFNTDEQFEHIKSETLSNLQVVYANPNHVTIETSFTKLTGHKQAWLSVKLRTNEDANELVTLIQHFDEKLSELQIEPFWTYTVQGELHHEKNQKENMFHLIKNQWQAKQMGAYEDAGSTSISFDSPLFTALAPYTGHHTGNVQVAIHEHSETGTSQLTVGIPAIPIEF